MEVKFVYKENKIFCYITEGYSFCPMPNIIIEGVATCHPDDVYDKCIGKELALFRAEQKLCKATIEKLKNEIEALEVAYSIIRQKDPENITGSFVNIKSQINKRKEWISYHLRPLYKQLNKTINNFIMESK